MRPGQRGALGMLPTCFPQDLPAKNWPTKARIQGGTPEVTIPAGDTARRQEAWQSDSLGDPGWEAGPLLGRHRSISRHEAGGGWPLAAADSWGRWPAAWRVPSSGQLSAWAWAGAATRPSRSWGEGALYRLLWGHLSPKPPHSLAAFAG